MELLQIVVILAAAGLPATAWVAERWRAEVYTGPAGLPLNYECGHCREDYGFERDPHTGVWRCSQCRQTLEHSQ